jgi:transcriptional regulator with AAA-type ATPase domain
MLCNLVCLGRLSRNQDHCFHVFAWINDLTIFYVFFYTHRPTPTNMGKPKKQAEIEVTLSKKDQKKVDKLQSQIPYHEGRGESDKAEKLKEQIDAIWTKAREAAFAV